MEQEILRLIDKLENKVEYLQVMSRETKLKKKKVEFDFKAEAIKEIINELKLVTQHEEYEPYFGWCDVEGCYREGANGGGCWRETGYWTVCSKHAAEFRAGKPQPDMKQSAIDREKKRGQDGIITNNE